MRREHTYNLGIKWTGNLGMGTESYTSYTRNHVIIKEGGQMILGSSDPAFRGDPQRYNPEELFLSTLSSCHMLMYLHFCASNNITVVSYEDNPVGTMKEEGNGSGRFTDVILRPRIDILEDDKIKQAEELHHQAHEFCFIANSVNFPVSVEPKIEVQQ